MISTGVASRPFLMEEGSHKAHRSAKAGRKADKQATRKKGDAGVSKNAKLNNPKVKSLLLLFFLNIFVL